MVWIDVQMLPDSVLVLVVQFRDVVRLIRIITKLRRTRCGDRFFYSIAAGTRVCLRIR